MLRLRCEIDLRFRKEQVALLDVNVDVPGRVIEGEPRASMHEALEREAHVAAEDDEPVVLQVHAQVG